MASRWIDIRWQRPPMSVRVARRTPMVLAGLLGLAALSLGASMVWGTETIAPSAAIKALLGWDGASAADVFVVRTLRLPRSLTALLVGMGFGAAGAVLQGLTRNPLAAPGIIGINAGASLAVVASLILLPVLPVGGLPLAAFAGSLLMSAAIYVLAWDRHDRSPVRLILVGIGLSLAAGACTSLLLTIGGIDRVSQALIWLVGSVYGRNWNHILAFLPWLIVFLPLALVLARALDILSLSDPVAKGLGLKVQRVRTFLLITGAALAGASVATAGTIGFVGLLAPHLARRLVGQSYLEVIPTAALTGGLLVLLADSLSRALFPAVEMPCGIMTVVLGVPYFLYLLARTESV